MNNWDPEETDLFELAKKGADLIKNTKRGGVSVDLVYPHEYDWRKANGKNGKFASKWDYYMRDEEKK